MRCFKTCEVFRYISNQAILRNNYIFDKVNSNITYISALLMPQDVFHNVITHYVS